MGLTEGGQADGGCVRGEPTRRGVVALDWDHALRRGFLVMDWARHLSEYGEIDSVLVHRMDRELGRYNAGIVSYSRIAHEVPALYAFALRGHQALRHTELAHEYIRTNGFLSPILPVTYKLMDLVSSVRSLRAVIISGSPAAVLRPFAAHVGVTDVWAVEPEIREGYFTGKLEDNPGLEC